MQPAAVRSLFLIDLLLLAYSADGTTKPDTDVEGHCSPSCRCAADAYTADGSHSLLTAKAIPVHYGFPPELMEEAALVTQDVIAILAVLLIFGFFGSIAAVVSYYVLDHSATLRNRPFMRSIRGSLEAAGTAVDNRLHLVGRIVLVLFITALGLVIVLAIVKWAFEELAK